MNSVYLKNCLLLAGIVLFGFFLFLTPFAIIIRNQTIADKEAGLAANVDSVIDLYNSFEEFDPNRAEHHETVRRLVSIVTLPHNRMVVANVHGVVVACSEDPAVCTHIGLEVPMETRAMLNTYGSFESLSTVSGLIDGLSYIHGQPIVCGISGISVGYALAASGADLVMEEWSAMISVFLLVAAAVLLVAIVLAMAVARHQAAPLKEMSSAAAKFAQGDYSARVEESGRMDEIGELEVAFNLMADAIEQSEDMRREFVGNVSHELKTPMTSITGFAEGMLDGTIPPEKQNEYLQIVASETKRLSRLVRQMLEVSRFQAMDFREINKQTFDITELLRRCLLGLESKITEKRLDVELDLPDDSVMVQGDPDSIMQVGYNLLDNTAKFATPGTTIGVTLKQKSGKAYITVRNEGPTISPEELPLIWSRFHKSDKSRSYDKEGVGLGLYIVKTIMNAHHEEVFVRSENGVTEFLFTLTLAPKKKKQQPPLA